MKIWLIVLCVCACGRFGFDPIDGPGMLPGPADGAVADGDLEVDAPVDAPVDTDGDGVPDNVDNCVAFPNDQQLNEDGDRFGDDCDPCPVLADADPVADKDGDGVSDPCDPFPEVAGDKIVVFERFDATPKNVGVVGDWTFTGGEAHVVSKLNEERALTWQPTITQGHRLTIMARGTIEELFGSGVGRPVGVVQRFKGSTVSGTFSEGALCAFGINTSNNPVFVIVDNKKDNVETSAPVELPDHASSTFAMTELSATTPPTNIGSYRCDGSATPTRLEASVGNVTITPNRLGLFTRSASARFAWAMIVDSPQ